MSHVAPVSWHMNQNREDVPLQYSAERPYVRHGVCGPPQIWYECLFPPCSRWFPFRIVEDRAITPHCPHCGGMMESIAKGGDKSSVVPEFSKEGWNVEW